MIKKNHQERVALFFQPLKTARGIHIPDDKQAELDELLREAGNLSVDLSQDTPLSAMETVIAALSLSGFEDNDISQSLAISTNTVKNYIRRIRNKLHVSCKLEAMICLLRDRIIKLFS